MQATEAALALARFRYAIAANRVLLAGERFQRVLKAGFRPDEPRVPASNPDGGQWTGGGGGNSQATRPHRNEAPTNHRERAQARKQYVIAGGGSHFDVAPNPNADGSAPWYEMPSKSTVARYDKNIEQVAREVNVDPNLIRAVMYVETTHGYYDSLVAVFGGNSSIRPMNINTDFWGDVWGDRGMLEHPIKNTRAGAKLLRGIVENMEPPASIAAIATLYNDLGASTISDYGARVQTVYRTRAWEKQK